MAERLSYEARFGDEIRGNVAAVRAAMAGGKVEEQPSLKGKYAGWFTDGKGYEEKPTDSRLIKITPGMALRELAAATLNNMKVLGEDSYDEFEKSMRSMVPHHRMFRSIWATVLDEKPQFGSCRIGTVQLMRDDTSDRVTATEVQYYITNFNAVVTTDENGKFYLRGNDFGRTIFGLVVDINERTGEDRFNQVYGRKGVLFQTSNPNDALVYMTAYSSGKSPREVSDWMKRSVRPVAQSRAPAFGFWR